MTVYLEFRQDTPLPEDGPPGDPCDLRECPSDQSIVFFEFSTIISTEIYTLDLGEPDPIPQGPVIYGIAIA